VLIKRDSFRPFPFGDRKSFEVEIAADAADADAAAKTADAAADAT